MWLEQLQRRPSAVRSLSAANADAAFLGHPRGLGWLSSAEFWERFSYYGMQSLLVLYMTHQLLQPGHVDHVAGFAIFRRAVEFIYGPLTPQALASIIFGFYAGLVFVTPVGGGYLADRILGRTRTVVIGALLMAAGHFLMAFEATFLPALLCILAGAGCFKGNIAAQVGELYSRGDPRAANGFQIYFVAISLAIIAAPLLCGTLGERYGYHWGFGAAGVGMIVGLVIYLRGRRWMPPEKSTRRTVEKSKRRALEPTEKRKVALMVALLPLFGIAQVTNYQVYNAYIVWAEASYRLEVFGMTMPVTWLFSFGSIISVLTIIASIIFWRWWAKRRVEPNEITKMTMSTLILAMGPLVPALGSYVVSTTGHKIGLGWAALFELINDIGYANFLPVGLALYSRVAPESLGGMMTGVYYLHLFAANMLAGWLGSFMERMPGTYFWLLHSAVVLGAALSLLLLRGTVSRLMVPAIAPAAEVQPSG
jgi:POT family proton-dependent oligopeptide transporter